MPEYFKTAVGRGDGGMTNLPGPDERGRASGKRVKKTAPVIKALGLLDELGAVLGLARAGLGRKKEAGELLKIQRVLLKAAAHAAGMNFAIELKKETARLGTLAETLSAGERPCREFVLPGRTGTEAITHLARAKARICEIALWEINSRAAAVYLNRLSDYLFLLASKK